ncbi:aspartate ammonia-lyase [Helicobacter monodelphidis]|uniref:aspartate ammonia-lyase n=1 Tax=Helicobacter sp. 15-1451 TaxID=2004995 RepID=UPI000DCEE0E0|nr:aspartate ammonia-lyase [Helicobacter sp. 15-1451]RAX58562.1 aspartate ammonia-lyase [Helicobacter sp. 15-1451]
MSNSTGTRIEHDLIGDKEISNEFYYGVQTARAQENFQISGTTLKIYPDFIKAFAQVKKAAAMANAKLGLLDNTLKDYICKACDEVYSGKYNDHFVVDMFQGGAGTSTNMNANEVIANVALELMGKKKGDYDHCHPNNHVNLSQSTNDSYPTAIHIALYNKIEKLLGAYEVLVKSFDKKAEEFKDVIKMGRTQLQDAVPMTLGQEFKGFADSIRDDMEYLRLAQKACLEVNMGATAIGTGINSHPNYTKEIEKTLCEVTGHEYTIAKNLIKATPDQSAYLATSSALKMSATKIAKICNDLRLLSSGPRDGIHEISLPAMQPGSSIMPGKVNPVIPEVVGQVCYYIIGQDGCVVLAAEAGQLQLNVFEPVAAYTLFKSLDMLKNALKTFATLCVDGIQADKETCREYVLKSIGLVTALNPYIGYAKSTEVAKEALEKNLRVSDLVIEKGYLTKEQVEKIIEPESLIAPREKIKF